MFGYLTDQEVSSRVVESLERRPDLLFVQLNSPDTFAHWFGPDSPEAKEAYRDLDRSLGVIDAALDLGRDLLLVTSDHDQETVEPSHRIDLASLAAERDPDCVVIHEGTAAVITGPGDLTWLGDVPHVEAWEKMAPGVAIACSEPGWWFAHPEFPDFHGAHGGPRTRSTIAVAAGPHRAIESIERDFLGPLFGADDWFRLVQRQTHSKAEDLSP
jgi:hypothetical protein